MKEGRIRFKAIKEEGDDDRETDFEDIVYSRGSRQLGLVLLPATWTIMVSALHLRPNLISCTGRGIVIIGTWQS